MAAWTAAPTAQFRNSMSDHRLYAAYHLIALRSLRRGEAAGLSWRDVDLDGKTAAPVTDSSGPADRPPAEAQPHKPPDPTGSAALAPPTRVQPALADAETKLTEQGSLTGQSPCPQVGAQSWPQDRMLRLAGAKPLSAHREGPTMAPVRCHTRSPPMPRSCISAGQDGCAARDLNPEPAD